jgi:hypothetical protein
MTMNDPISLQDAVWEIASARAENQTASSCWAALVLMLVDEELTATGRIGDPINDHAPIPRAAWPHITPRDQLWFDPVETVTGRPIFDVSVYRTNKFSDVGDTAGSDDSYSMDAIASGDTLPTAEPIENALARVVADDRVWSWAEYEAALAPSGAMLNAAKERIGGINGNRSGAPPLMATALLMARYRLCRARGDYRRNTTSHSAIGRELHAWLVRYHGSLAYARGLDLTNPRNADELLKVLRRSIPD